MPLMIYDTDIPPPERKTELVRKIRDMPRHHSLLFSRQETTPESVRTVVSRVRQQFPSRVYRTAVEDKGIRVWRLT